MFKFELKGVEQTIQDLEAHFSPAALLKAKDKALTKGAEFLKDKLYIMLDQTKDTGAARDELTFSKPQWIDGERVITLHWRGNKDRYRVIHLIENGFYDRSGNFKKPEGYGQIENVLAANRVEYIKIVADELQRQIAG
ncbi:hypothetical protein ACFOU0_06070 [Salinicoccus sesuvii]|uniref:HK97 gp10 family phage protein n=1 Tax=Salinicoccus sesuvii TaxID=868281 RepID=A0ABV7N4X9_9STAP